MADEDLIDELLEDARARMAQVGRGDRHEFATVRTGRASPALLERIVVDYYGARPRSTSSPRSPRRRRAC